MPIESSLLAHVANSKKTFTHWDLSYQKLTSADVKPILETLSKASHIISLDISHNQLGDEGAILLASNTTLRQVCLHGNKIGLTGVKALAQNNGWLELDLSYNDAGDDGFAVFKDNKSLRRLIIWSNGITDQGAINFSGNTTLEQLDLTINQVSDAGVNALQICPRLNHLILRHNQISDGGGLAIANNARLRVVDLRDNRVAASVTPAFEKNQTLISLNLANNTIDNESLAKIERQITANYIALLEQRFSFVFNMAILAIAHHQNNTSITALPIEMWLHISDFLNFPAKSQAHRPGSPCARFIFENSQEIQTRIRQQQSLKFLEQRPTLDAPVSQFTFFKPFVIQISSVQAEPDSKHSFANLNI